MYFLSLCTYYIYIYIYLYYTHSKIWYNIIYIHILSPSLSHSLCAQHQNLRLTDFHKNSGCEGPRCTKATRRPSQTSAPGPALWTTPPGHKDWRHRRHPETSRAIWDLASHGPGEPRFLTPAFKSRNQWQCGPHFEWIMTQRKHLIGFTYRVWVLPRIGALSHAKQE